MKIKLYSLLAILCLATLVYSCEESNAPDGGDVNTDQNDDNDNNDDSDIYDVHSDEFWEGELSLQRVPLADPYIMYHEGMYYAYGTGARSKDGIEMWVSKDLEGWKQAQNKERGYFALHKDDSYGDVHFWAPEVYPMGDQFMMYYTAQQRICVAWADSPTGPFKQENGQEAMLHSNGNGFISEGPLGEFFCIDNHLFIDDDGTPYIYYVKSGLNVYAAKLNDDYTEIIPGTEKLMIKPTNKTWEVFGSVNEGPYIHKHKDTYYMTYSANAYFSQEYAVGYATATNPMGPWKKADAHNPILKKPKNSYGAVLYGTGHHAFFYDKNNDLNIVFHAHQSQTSVHHRTMHFAKVTFEPDASGIDRMVIDGDNYKTAWQIID